MAFDTLPYLFDIGARGNDGTFVVHCCLRLKIVTFIIPFVTYQQVVVDNIRWFGTMVELFDDSHILVGLAELSDDYDHDE